MADRDAAMVEVVAALTASGLRPPDVDIALLCELHLHLREFVSVLDEVVEAEEETPELIFDPRR